MNSGCHCLRTKRNSADVALIYCASLYYTGIKRVNSGAYLNHGVVSTRQTLIFWLYWGRLDLLMNCLNPPQWNNSPALNIAEGYQETLFTFSNFFRQFWEFWKILAFADGHMFCEYLGVVLWLAGTNLVVLLITELRESLIFWHVDHMLPYIKGRQPTALEPHVAL